MKYVVEQDKLRPDLLRAVEELSGQDVRNCYQCGKCSAGCPIAADMDLPPNQVMRFLQLGLAEAVLRSRTIWLCASCETCTTRCPREADLASVMDALRNLALREEITPAEKVIPFFNRTFLRLVKRYGRVYEMELIGRFNLGTLHLFKDMMKAPKLFLRGRLKLWPSLKGRKTANSVFKDVKKLHADARAASKASSKKEDSSTHDETPEGPPQDRGQ